MPGLEKIRILQEPLVCLFWDSPPQPATSCRRRSIGLSIFSAMSNPFSNNAVMAVMDRSYRLVVFGWMMATPP